MFVDKTASKCFGYYKWYDNNSQSLNITESTQLSIQLKDITSPNVSLISPSDAYSTTDTTFVQDTIITPIDSIINDSIIQDTIIMDTTIVEDTIVYTPYFFDENIFLYFSDKNYSKGDLFDYQMELSNISTNMFNSGI